MAILIPADIELLNDRSLKEKCSGTGRGPGLRLCLSLQSLEKDQVYTAAQVAALRYPTESREYSLLAQSLRKLATKHNSDGKMVTGHWCAGANGYKGDRWLDFQDERGHIRGKMAMSLENFIFSSPGHETPTTNQASDLISRIQKLSFDDLAFRKLLRELNSTRQEGSLAHTLKKYDLRKAWSVDLGRNRQALANEKVEVAPIIETNAPKLKPGIRRFIPKSLPRLIGVASMVLIMTAAAARVSLNTEFLLDVLREKGVTEAWNYAQTSSPRTPEEYYGMAWMLQRMNMFDQAEKMAFKTIRHAEDVELQAKTHYLLGILRTRQGKTTTALQSFGVAGSLRSDPTWNYLVNVEQARTMWLAGNNIDAEEKLAIAFENFQPNEIVQPNVYYYLKSWIEFEKGNLDRALEYTLTNIDILETSGNQTSLPYAINDLGFIYMAMGQLEKGSFHTLRAMDLFIQREGKNSEFNMLNHAFLNKCIGEDNTHILAEIGKGLAQNPDHELIHHLELMQRTHPRQASF